MSADDSVFTGAVAKFYETYMVPLIFEPYAEPAVRRALAPDVADVLEIAAGTGVVTRALALASDERVRIVATDLNQAMLDQAAAIGTARPVRWRQADAMRLPFADASFDAVVCQFGAMFFPDRVTAFAQARRVLRPGGRFVFSTWDRIEDNEFADTVTAAMASVFPSDPPRFLARTPHGCHDISEITRDLAQAGFGTSPRIDTVTARSRADSARTPAVAYCHGTPLRDEIEARGDLDQATSAAEQALTERFGSGPVDGRIQAHIVTVVNTPL
ncbi:methyltransferase domain-containing protein [Nocardia sp. NBC_01503]|uniref:class I SAM-dependent methyltransferase n=1 Tax=Nocardia sp. NBC_01503 TaxID=2975997 RepID=UPI002E7B038F|nr:methyltransferase domain-containing protein [Nocardia sp. NBC_01503]WTL31434.1 methyltransferase domain-containing protein [Nocardia sp. NBC_01503]